MKTAMSQDVPPRAIEPTLSLIGKLRSVSHLDSQDLWEALRFRRPEVQQPRTVRDWDRIQLCPAQLATKPLLESTLVSTDLVLGVGKNSALRLGTPLLLEKTGPKQEAHGWLTRDGGGQAVITHGGEFKARSGAALYVQANAIDRYRAGLAMLTDVPFGVRSGGDNLELHIRTALTVGADFFLIDAPQNGVRVLSQARRHLKNLQLTDHLPLLLASDTETPADFVKALAVGAQGVIWSPELIATIERVKTENADCLATFHSNSLALMKVLARACGHNLLSEFSAKDATTWHSTLADIEGLSYSGSVETSSLGEEE